MVRIGASVDCEPVFSTVVYIAAQTNVACNAFRAATTIPKYISSVQPNLLWTSCLWLMDIGALPRRCHPFSLTESGPLKGRTKHNNGVQVPFSPSAHERQCEALEFMDRPFQVLMTRLERKNKKDVDLVD